MVIIFTRRGDSRRSAHRPVSMALGEGQRWGGDRGRHLRQRQRTALLSLPSLLVIIPAMLVTLPGYVASETFYPPFINAALSRPIEVNVTAPAGFDPATCGEPRGSSDKYCLSFNVENSVRNCLEESCTSVCPHGDANPYSVELLKAISTGFIYPACVQRESGFLAPAWNNEAGTQSVRFQGGSVNCFLPIVKESIIVVTLSDWDVTLSLWVYNDLGNVEGTLVDIRLSASDSSSVLRVYLDSDLLRIKSGSVTLEHDNWRIPLQEWTHLAIQLAQMEGGTTVSVLINGEHAYPTFHNQNIRSIRSAFVWQIGKSIAAFDPFVGYMQDFRVHNGVLPNRAIYQLYNGTLPGLRIESPCYCSKTHPAVSADDETYCRQNTGPGQSDDTGRRLNQDTHPLQYANDGKSATHWISRNGATTVWITLDLGHVLEVRHVTIDMYSPYPALVTIERKADPSAAWSVWQYYSQNCLAETGYEGNAELYSEDDVNCRLLVGSSEAFPYSGGHINFDILQGRPGGLDAVFPPILRAFMMASAVRVTLKDHPHVSNDFHKYHGVNEIKVNATCDCNGHGTDCFLDTSPYTCRCAPSSYTTGRQCDVCVNDTYQDADKPIYHPDVCNPCQCDVRGAKTGSDGCSGLGGQCLCKDNVEGRACDTCKSGFFNLSATNVLGCSPCDCHPDGTLFDSTCDNVTGQCQCKTHVEGSQCDRCKEGFSSLGANNTDGCVGCSCSEAGSLNGTLEDCDLGTSQCQCKSYVTGVNCDRCVDGTYNLQAGLVEGCTPCRCDASGAYNATCQKVTGQCHCRPNVVGVRCDQCAAGYFAQNATEFADAGCPSACDCDDKGASQTATCEKFGGQCACKKNVEGRRCERCDSYSYHFGRSDDFGCLACDCDTRGMTNASRRCDADTGQCDCKAYTDGARCDACKLGSYGLSAEAEGGCLSCDCNPRGTQQGTQCNATTGQCRCIEGDGVPSLGQRTCSPYISSVHPLYGPEVGGTNVTLKTGYLGDVSGVQVTLKADALQCDVMRNISNVTHVACVTRTIVTQGLSFRDQPLGVYITLNDGAEVHCDERFIYKKDPIIKNIEPLKTILSGGTKMTVTGQYLNSVAFPLMRIFMEHRAPGSQKTTVTMFESGCDVTTLTSMICLTPPVTLPPGVAKRSVVATLRREAAASSSHPRQLRQRRQADNGETPPDSLVNNDDLWFYLGFILDGVEDYRNMSHYRVNVYPNPNIYSMGGPDNVKAFRIYWPFSDQVILISGERLTHGATPSDYNVQIGDSECDNISVTDSHITCKPPAKEPKPQSQTALSFGQPEVVVHVGNIHTFVGYLDYEHHIWEFVPFRLGIYGAIAAVVLIILLIVIGCCICKRREKRKKSNSTASHAGTENSFDSVKTKTSKKSGKRMRSFISAYDSKAPTIQPYSVTSSTDLLAVLPEALQLSIKDVLIDKSRLDMGKVIGEGNFGMVHIGRLRNEGTQISHPIAIKTLKDGGATRKDIIQFLEEATVMRHFQHDNVLGLTGVVIDEYVQSVRVVLPYMENGDLKNFIVNQENMLTVGELIHFALQIASGMAYLAEQKFVHRDLACRNVMVNKDLIVKIADFGLSRDIYEQDYYRVSQKKVALPVKWMALESLEQGFWSTKSDVWSYGVVMWELLTRGCNPYPDVDSYDVKSFLQCGNRMDRPDYAPDEMYSLMIKCWVEDPDARPSFRQIRDRLSYFLNETSTKTFTRDTNGQQVPSVAFRGRAYLKVM